MTDFKNLKILPLKKYEFQKEKFEYEFISALTDYFNEFNFDVYTSGENGIYINIPLSYDIETTSFYDQAGQKNALCYIWQFGIYNHVWYGRHIEDFAELVNKDLSEIVDKFLRSAITLKNEKRKNELKKNFHIVIYCHNLNFEFAFTNKLLNIDRTENSLLALAPRELIKFKLSKSHKRITIEFRCSQKLTMLSLRDVAKKTFNRKDLLKQEPIDYTLIRTPATELTEKEIDYACYDVYVTNNIIHEKFEYGEMLCDIPYTATGYPRKFLKKVIKENSSKTYNRILKNTEIKSISKYQLYKSAYFGGFTHASFFNAFVPYENCEHLDITSSYPTVMISEKYPIQDFNLIFTNDQHLETKAIVDFLALGGDHTVEVLKSVEFWINTDLETLRKMNLGFIVDVTFQEIDIKDNVCDYPISTSKIIRTDETEIIEIFNGRVKKAKNIRMQLTDVDYHIYKKAYNIKGQIIHTILYSIFDYLPYEMIYTILSFYEQKTKLKGQDERLYQFYKGQLNSIYGMCVTDPIKESYIYTDDGLTNEYSLHTSPEEHQIELRKKLKNNNKNHKLFYPWGVFCSAYARKNLFDAIFECGIDYLYADTDSIFCLNFAKHKNFFDEYNSEIQKKLKANTTIKKHSELEKMLNATDRDGNHYPLGVWTTERAKDKDPILNKKLKNSKITFCSIGAKRYCQVFCDSETNEPLKLQVTFAGVKPQYIEKELLRLSKNDLNYAIEIFSNIGERDADTFIVPNSYMATVYFNDTRAGTIIDYQGKEYSYKTYGGVHLEKVDYEINEFSENFKMIAIGVADLRKNYLRLYGNDNTQN